MTDQLQLTSARRRSRFAAIVVYTLQSCIPPKRWFALLLPCVGALLFGLLALAVDNHFPTIERAFANVAAEGIFALVVPIASLVIGDAVLGAEVRAGTFHFTWLSPTPTWQIVLGRWLGGSFVALVTIAPASALAAVIAGSPSAIVFLVERLLGAALTGIAQLSPTWESRAIFLGYLHDPPARLIRSGIPQGGAAVARLLIVTVVALVIANWRMARMRLSGAAD